MIQQYPRLFLELIVVSIFIIIMYSFKFNYLNNEEVIVLVGLFATSSFRLVPSIQRIINAYNDIKFHKSSLNIILEVCQKKIEPMHNEYDEVKIEKNLFKDRIKVVSINFSFGNDNKFKLENANLEIEKGKLVGLVGDSGSGKSTMVNLITWLIYPEKRNIFFDGEKISKQNVKKWQKCIGYVPQKIHLYDDTILNNIKFNFQNCTDDGDINDDNRKILEIINKVGLKDYILNLKYGIFSKISELGNNLSGGQLQRIGIARALYRDPEILILDESTSSLVRINEKLILDIVYSLSGAMTCIIISHKKENLKKCNRIYKIKNGKVIIVDYDEI